MDNYDLIKQVGEGSFGQVFKAKRKFDGATVAYKVTRKKGRTDKELISLRRECEIQKGMHHPNIIQMLDSFETESKIVVVTEYVETELYEVVSKAGRLSEMRAAVIAGDLVSALHYLHSRRIVHRDMKPQNVLMDQNGVSKLCDFGFATLMQDFVLMSIKGTPLYMAPELMDDQPYDHTVDLWSLGCIVYELVTGKTPFQTTNLRELVQLVRYEEIKLPDHITLECRNFLEGLLKKDANERLSWPDLLEHPFVKGRILIVDEDAPRSLTSPLSASQTKAKQQQIQSLASRFTSQSKKIIEKQFKKIHSQVLRRSGTSGSETSASVDVLLNNLSLRASLRSDLVAVGNATNCQTDCSIIEEENLADQLTITECKANHTIPDLSVSMQPAACCLEALQESANAAATAAAAAVYQQWDLMLQNKRRSESHCLSGLNNTNSNSCLSTSLGEFKNMSASRISSEHERELKNIMERRARLPGWRPRDDVQPIENDEWTASLQSSIEEAMDGDISMLLQKNCLILFTSPLKNPGASCQSIEFTASLLSLPFVLDSVTSDDLDQLQKVYLESKVVPDLVYAVKLLTVVEKCGTETEASSVASRWKSGCELPMDVLQAVESIVLVLCRLVHSKQEFLTQLCDAIFVIPDGTRTFQGLLGLEKRTPRIVSDLLAIMSEILRSQTGNVELVEQIFQNKSTDEMIDLFTKLLSHKQNKLRSRVCIFLLLLGKFSQKTLQRVWGKALRDLLEGLTESRENSVQYAATEAVTFLRQLSFYQQDKDAWNIIET